MTRLMTYRAFLATMSPSSTPSEALDSGYYVDPPSGGVWQALTRKLELDPASTHLVLGGIGSGKTSELLRANLRLREAFRQTGDVANYCDLSRHHDLAASPRKGVLFALVSLMALRDAGLETLEPPEHEELAKAVTEIRAFATGHVEWRFPQPDDDDYDDEPPEQAEPDLEAEYEAMLEPVHHPGVLESPQAKPERIDYRLSQKLPRLEQILEHHPGKDRATVALFDSLDRLPQPATFKVLVEDDLRALKRAGVGVVVVGPVRFIVGHDRALTDLFDHVHYQLAIDPDTDEGMNFLCEVLRRRANDSPLLSNEECLRALAHASGGVLRDLIALTKLSAEEAYAAGHPQITIGDIDTASEAFGRSLALGLDDEQVKVLKGVSDAGAFVVRGERELSLLETRRVLLYPANRWVVHPTLKGMITNLPEPGA